MKYKTRGALAVMRVLAVIKWVLVALWLVGGVWALSLIYYATDWPLWTQVPVVAVAVVGAVLIWALVGYRQHMLGLQALIAQSNDSPVIGYAQNTAAAGESVDVRLR